MKNHESKFGLLFRSWWRANRIPGVFELKDTRGRDSLPFREVDEAQIESGIANVSSDGNLVRIQSGTVGTGDYIGIVEYPSYIVVRFPAFFSLIPVRSFKFEMEHSGKKSLDSKRTKEIAFISVVLKK